MTPTLVGGAVQDESATSVMVANVGWQTQPIIPVISHASRQIYFTGLVYDNRSTAFSKVGDCNSLSENYLRFYDRGATAFNLGNHAELLPVIQQFAGSFERQSLVVGNGYNTATVLSSLHADPEVCETGESPLVCEYRLHQPSFALIAIGTDDDEPVIYYETNLRRIIAITIEMGIVPVLATLMDEENALEYNAVIAKVARDYDIPLMNLWRAMQPLPDQGLADNTHPSGGFTAYDFSGDALQQFGWPVRNLTALQALDAVWRGVAK